MQIIEAALAFAITMLVLSLTCSSFVEIVHRVLSMREAGLKYMLGQVFDQVLKKYLKPEDVAKLAGNVPGALKADAAKLAELARQSFVDRMSANRAPMGAVARETPAGEAQQAAGKPASIADLWSRVRLWNGRDLASMTPAEFMERLGSLDLGEVIKQANETANAEAREIGAAAADRVDAVLKDVAQKFEAFGNEAGAYFEGRARLLSVCVAIVLAFAIRIDAIELLNTYLRDPNARNKVIEQTQAVTAQYKAAKEAADALKKISDANPPPDVKTQVEALQKEWQSTIDGTRTTVKQYADLGLPIGWTKQNATLDPSAKTCSRDGMVRVLENGEKCDGVEGTVGWWTVLKLVGSLLLGGLLVGLGGPFWYNAVTGLTNIRNIAKDVAGGRPETAAPNVPAAPGGAPPIPVSTSPDRPQPVTPVGAFQVSNAARR